MIVTLFNTGSDGTMLYYTIHDRQASLTQPYTLTVSWSRGSGRGREKFYTFDSLEAKDKMTRSLLAKRFKTGYRLLYSFSRDAGWKAPEAVESPSPGPGRLHKRA